MDMSRKLTQQVFMNREEQITHLAYERENAFFQAIRDGNQEEVRRLFKPFDSSGLGKLSDDPLRNCKYHLIITVALITRACIEGGMEMEEAYNLSDLYIRTIDRCSSTEEVSLLHKELVMDYAQRMQLQRRKRYPRSVTVCIDYIYDNLHKRLTLPDLAAVTGLSVGYLSRLFRKEVGVPLSEFITRKRVEAAENMLKYSEFSCLEIAEYLCFSSESHFIQVFRKLTGYTPRRYREEFFRVRTAGGVKNTG